jgi:hypothetical protein
MRLDHVVDESVFGGYEGVGETLLKFPSFCATIRLGQGPVQDVHCSFGSHHGDFSGGPGQIHVAAQMLRSHHAISAAVSFPGDHGDLWNGGLGVGV